MIKLLVGLGNPGREYEQTRHNAGVWFIEALLKEAGARLKPENKLRASSNKIEFSGHTLRVAVPMDYMNLSGQSVAALQHYYKIEAEETLIIHDEIDLMPGTARIKFSGGEGGHNGLRSIAAATGTKAFYRLRIGVGHPGRRQQVVNYVLGKPSADETVLIDQSIEKALTVLPAILDGAIEKAMTQLHTA